MNSVVALCFMVLRMTATRSVEAVAITSGPTLLPSTNAPLAGTLELSTDVPARVSVLVDDGINVWEKDFYNFSTTNAEILLGFKPRHTNELQVSVHDVEGNTYNAPQLLTFITAPLPTNFPTLNVLSSNPNMMEPGYMLFIIGGAAMKS